jgi:putative resolvase
VKLSEWPRKNGLASRRRIVVMGDSEIEDDLVRDMTEILTSFCVRLYGRRGARRRAQRGVIAAGEGRA